MLPSSIYILAFSLLWGPLAQATGFGLNWDQVGPVTLLVLLGGGVWALLTRGTLRLGVDTAETKKLLQDQIDVLKGLAKDQKADGDKRIADAQTEADRRYSEYVAQSNQRLADTISDWRGRLAEQQSQTNYWRDAFLRVTVTTERLQGVAGDAINAMLKKDG